MTKFRLLPLAALLLLPACGSLVGRTPTYSEPWRPWYFNGVLLDANIIGGTFDQFGCPAWFRCLTVLDLPVSLVADVVLLPLDAIVWWARPTRPVPQSESADRAAK